MSQLQGDGACFSDDEMYRYRLWRTWDASLPRLLWVLLNPSTADGETNDATVRACIGFTCEWQRRLSGWQYGGIEIVNLFAFRSTSRSALRMAVAPIGPDNDRYIVEAAQRAPRVVVAWGEHGSYRQRVREVCALLKEYAPLPLYCLGKNSDGSPRHPLYVPYSTDPIPYQCDAPDRQGVYPPAS